MWEEFLKLIGQGGSDDSPKPINTEDQLRQLQTATKGTPAQNAAARKAGFKNYAEQVARTQQLKIKGGSQGSDEDSGDGDKAPMGLDTAKAIHPMSMFQHISDILAGVNEKMDGN